MAAPRPSPDSTREPIWLTNLVGAEPRVPLVVPFMAYLLLLPLQGLFPSSWQPVSISLHIGLAAWVTWLLRHHLPAWGKAHLAPAVVVGLLAAWLWVAGQHLLDGVGIGGHNLGETLSVGLGPPFVTLVPAEWADPGQVFGSGRLFWAYVALKIGRAVLIVPIVEELFWRGFMLRSLVNWDRYDRVPWGQFTWVAFLGTSFLSVLQHPGNWGVSIACWMLYNALFYWKKSLLCLMVTHAITNLALYIYVVQSGDWRFW